MPTPNAVSAAIAAMRAHAEELRKQAKHAPEEYGARVTLAEAERWQKLADDAERSQ